MTSSGVRSPSASIDRRSGHGAPETTSAAPRGTWTWALAALLPALVWLTTPVLMTGRDTGLLDPYVYTSLIHDYANVMDRYGATYYAERIAHIFPAAFLESHLGVRTGYLAYHTLLLALAALTTHGFATAAFSHRVGLLGVFVVTLTPWLFFSLLSDHYDGAAGVYLLVAQLLSVAPVARPGLAHAAAGTALALAANINLFPFLVFGTTFPGWLLVHGHRGWRSCGRLAAGGLGLFALTTLAIVLALRVTHPAWHAASPTMAMVRLLWAGRGSDWFHSFGEVVAAEGYYFLAGAFAALLLAILTCVPPRPSPQERRLAIAAIVNSTAVLALFAAGHLVFRLGALGLHYYVVYFFPSFVMTSVCIWGAAERVLAPAASARMVATAGLATGVLWFALRGPLLEQFDRVNAAGSLVLAAATVALAGTLAIRRRPRAAAVTAAAACLAAAYWPFQVKAIADARDPSTDGWDLKMGVIALVDTVQRLSPVSEGRVGFWYPNAAMNLHSVQAGFLWASSRIAPTAGDGMPVIDDPTRAAIASYERLVLLAEDDARLDAGLRSLDDLLTRNRTPMRVERGRFDGSTWGYRYAFVERGAMDIHADRFAAADHVATLPPVAAHVLSSRATVRPDGGGALITTDPANGGYSLGYPLTAVPARIRLRLRTRQGSVGAVVTDAADVNRWLTPEALAPAGRETILDFEIDGQAPALLLLRNGHDGGASVATILAIDVYRPAPEAATAAAP